MDKEKEKRKAFNSTSQANKNTEKISPKNSNATLEEKKILKAIKAKVFELEKENEEYVYLYHSGGRWWKCGGNSAQYLVHVVAPQLHGAYNPRILPDQDFSIVFETGTISIPDVNKVVGYLESLGMKKEEDAKKYGEKIYAFRLKEAVKKEDLRKMLSRDATKKQKLDEVLAVVNADPEIASIIQAMQKVSYSMVKSLSKIDRELVGKRILDANADLYLAYRDWANGYIEDGAAMEKMLQQIDSMSGYMLVAMENEIFTIEEISKYTFKLETLRAAINKRKKFKKINI